jgi:hypothetical protein
MTEESYNVPGKIYAGEWNFVPQAISVGAHAYSVLVAAFCRNELSITTS